MSFREQLAHIMRIRDVKPKALAHLSGVSQRYINALLAGERESPSIEKTRSLARALDVSLDSLANLPKRNPDGLEPDEDELLRQYRSLDPEDKRLVLEDVKLHARIMGDSRGEDSE